MTKQKNPTLLLFSAVPFRFGTGCPKHGTKPKSNAAFWKAKLEKNVAWDRLVTRTLRSKGWRVLRIWEHELSRKNRARLLRRIDRALHQTASASD